MDRRRLFEQESAMDLASSSSVRQFTSTYERRTNICAAIIPITAFILGSWQVQRLGWKTELIAKFEDRLVRDPLPLPPTIDPSAVHEFDYRRVTATGRFRHDQEMLIGPRMRDGTDGYMVITPLEREDATTILINRGWIDKKHRDQRTRPDGLPKGEVTVEGLLREPWKKNMFTPDNQPERGLFYFPDVKQMAELTGSQPVWVEATMGMHNLRFILAISSSSSLLTTAEPEFMQMVDYEARGIPYGRAAEVNLRNNHAQYIFTWYVTSLIPTPSSRVSNASTSGTVSVPQPPSCCGWSSRSPQTRLFVG
jgi:surfeit locus 1 family protein